jgi:hypothetical protein
MPNLNLLVCDLWPILNADPPRNLSPSTVYAFSSPSFRLPLTKVAGTGVVQFISEKPYAIRVISSLYKAVVRRLLTVFSLKSPECLIIALNLARYLLGIEGA